MVGLEGSLQIIDNRMIGLAWSFKIIEPRQGWIGRVLEDCRVMEWTF